MHCDLMQTVTSHLIFVKEKWIFFPSKIGQAYVIFLNVAINTYDPAFHTGQEAICFIPLVSEHIQLWFFFK